MRRSCSPSGSSAAALSQHQHRRRYHSCHRMLPLPGCHLPSPAPSSGPDGHPPPSFFACIPFVGLVVIAPTWTTQ
uniref:Uncharacterized protein n=1 Tax=Setaria viridis TaxID=4556 RepID=A0A4U6VVV6_SETVI|nr:hypothetical protein SEVIR_2G282150v2 [Setaria viridis]